MYGAQVWAIVCGRRVLGAAAPCCQLRALRNKEGGLFQTRAWSSVMSCVLVLELLSPILLLATSTCPRTLPTEALSMGRTPSFSARKSPTHAFLYYTLATCVITHGATTYHETFLPHTLP